MAAQHPAAHADNPAMGGAAILAGEAFLTGLDNDHNIVTMVKMIRPVPAGEFKAKCLALLDEVAATGRPILVTKRGRPVARIVPVDDRDVPSLRGSIVHQGDVVSPVGERWDAER
jgi:prevent-host-death family protein